MTDPTKGKVTPKEKGKGFFSRRSKADVEKARKEAADADPGALFWLPTRLDGPDQAPQMIDDPYPAVGIPAIALYPRILREGKPFEIRGPTRLGAKKGDRGIAIELIMNDPRVRYDRAEVIDKGLMTPEDFAAIDKGEHPDEHKDTPNEVPQLALPDIDLLTNAEAIDFCKEREIHLPAGADPIGVKAHIKKALGLEKMQ